MSVLPDTYNWKPYWGHPQAGTWGKAPAVKILHIHGPKFQESLCVLKFLGTYGLTDASNTTLLAKIKGWCKYERSQYSMQLLLNANKARARPDPPEVVVVQDERGRCSMRLLLDASRAHVYPTLTLGSSNSAPHVNPGGRHPATHPLPSSSAPWRPDIPPTG